MEIIRKYIDHVRNIRRYSERTVRLYEDVLNRYVRMVFPDGAPDESGFIESFNRFEIRGFMVALMEDEGLSPKSVSLHMSALSSFCRYLVKEGKLKSNPVRMVIRPKVEKRLPEYFREEAMQAYFDKTREEASSKYLVAFKENLDNDNGKRLYQQRLARLIISILYDTGLRRSELIGLKIENVDFARQTLKVVGKGNKMREIPLLASLCQEILLY
jgi:integrase/recombinase XerC